MNHFSNTTPRDAEWLIKQTFSSILSLCLVVAISATIAGFSEPETPSNGETMPVTHIVTDITGRKLEGTILSKNPNSIQFSRTSDGKKFTLELNKLSAEDQAFINKLTVAPVKKPRLFLMANNSAELKVILEKNFEVTVAQTEKVAERNDGAPLDKMYEYPYFGDMTDNQISDFDVIWKDSVLMQIKNEERIRKIAKTFQGAFVFAKAGPTTRKAYFTPLSDKERGKHDKRGTKAYIITDKNMIFFNIDNSKYDREYGLKEIDRHPEIYGQASDEAIRILADPTRGGLIEIKN